MWYLLIAYIIKIALQLPFTVYLGVYGPLLSSTIAFAVMGHFAFRLINKEFGIVDKDLAKKLVKVTINSIIMFLIVGASVFLLSLVINDQHKVGATVVLSIGAIIGIIVYGFLGYKDGSLKILKEIRNTEIY
jgi:O-antigen/teichoic acid export membrane protein